MSQGAGACPQCRSTNTKVTNVRHESKQTVRNHLCRQTSCGKKWKTVQRVARFVGWA